VTPSNVFFLNDCIMALEKQEFESDLFGRRIALLETSQLEISLATKIVLDQFDLVQAKVRSQDSAAIDQLTSSEFRLCEGEIDLELSLTTGSEPQSPITAYGCRYATQDDIPSLSKLAADCFEGKTRFRRPWYSEEEARLMYSTWIAKAVRGEFDDVCLMITHGHGEPLAFVTLRKMQHSSDVRVGLLAVRECARRQGLGASLLGAASTWALQNGGIRLKVATQMSNLNAIRLYLKAKAKPVGTSYWFYRQESKAL
jgi:dTDP-4-amino-4,6-dideoxy-D-galactose acyltransferase